jgi:hypothetical protein
LAEQAARELGSGLAADAGAEQNCEQLAVGQGLRARFEQPLAGPLG